MLSNDDCIFYFLFYMRLLIITQIVDRTDRELGFFHEWLVAFAEKFERITVIGLKVGEYELPANVQVLSLGKPALSGPATGWEHAGLRVQYVTRFYRYIWKYRHDYDAVYIHQNQEYATLGGLLWRMLGKRVTLWRNHYAGSWRTDLAAFFCHKVFCTSKYSYTAKYTQTVIMPVGVSDRMFYPHDDIERIPRSILSLGRIAPSKKLEQLIEAFSLLIQRGVAFTASIVGSVQPEYEEYLADLKAKASVMCARESCSITFLPGAAYREIPEIYSAHDIFVNLSKSGMLDKTMFEAMLCETLVVSCNKDLRGEIRDQFLFEEDNPADLADRLEAMLSLAPDDRLRAAAGLRAYAAREHALSQLVLRLHEELSDSVLHK
jgi:glycosyltransferase involved in cell wall biosynthesis